VELVVGVDAGGSTTRAVLVDENDVVRATATADAGNAVAVPPGELADRIAGCLRECLVDVDLAAVGCVAAGLAGLRANPGAAKAVEAAARTAGLTCPVRVYSDLEVAFAAGSDEPDGVVLIAGTGAAAARLQAYRAVATADGAGWLLGDEGSGFWIARRAVQAVLAAIDGRGQPTGLEPALCAELQAVRETPAVVAAAMALPPPQLAALAPRVFAVAAAGDEVARGIVDEAVLRLVHTVSALRPQPGEPLVLAGGLLGPDGPLAERVSQALPEHRCVPVSDGVRGAARLARMALAEIKFCH
jgi:glucosamine kinase